MRITSVLPLILLAFTACGSGGSTNLQPLAGTPNSGPTTANKSGSQTQLVVSQAQFPVKPTVNINVNPEGGASVTLLGRVQGAVFSPSVDGDLLVGSASSYKIVSPKPNGCKLKIFALDAIGQGSHFLTIAASDSAGSTLCRDFISAAAGGLTLEFTAVPLGNAPSTTIATVNVSISIASGE